MFKSNKMETQKIKLFNYLPNVGYACVVDMGDQKTSISCVEDGISHPETRIHLDYGGADITQVDKLKSFLKLL